MSLTPQESRKVLDCSEDDEGDQSASETRIPMPISVRDQQIQTCSQRKAQTGEYSNKKGCVLYVVPLGSAVKFLRNLHSL